MRWGSWCAAGQGDSALRRRFAGAMTLEACLGTDRRRPAPHRVAKARRCVTGRVEPETPPRVERDRRVRIGSRSTSSRTRTRSMHPSGARGVPGRDRYVRKCSSRASVRHRQSIGYRRDRRVLRRQLHGEALCHRAGTPRAVPHRVRDDLRTTRGSPCRPGPQQRVAGVPHHRSGAPVGLHARPVHRRVPRLREPRALLARVVRLDPYLGGPGGSRQHGRHVRASCRVDPRQHGAAIAIEALAAAQGARSQRRAGSGPRDGRGTTGAARRLPVPRRG